MHRRKPQGSLVKAAWTRCVQAICLGLCVGALGCGGAAPSAGTAAGSQAVNAGGAIATAIAAGALWAVGGGCRLQGCPYGSYCDQKTGYCAVRKCSEGCPPGTVCNEGLGRCQAAPPAQAPSDFLPQDNALLPPGTH